jgi:hypothetical protein
VASLAFQVNDGPVVFPLLNVAEFKVHCFVPAQAAGEQYGEECTISFALEGITVRCIPEPLRLFRSQPIPKTNTDLLDSLDASYAGG